MGKEQREQEKQVWARVTNSLAEQSERHREALEEIVRLAKPIRLMTESDEMATACGLCCGYAMSAPEFAGLDLRDEANFTLALGRFRDFLSQNQLKGKTDEERDHALTELTGFQKRFTETLLQERLDLPSAEKPLTDEMAYRMLMMDIRCSAIPAFDQAERTPGYLAKYGLRKSMEENRQTQTLSSILDAYRNRAEYNRFAASGLGEADPVTVAGAQRFTEMFASRMNGKTTEELTDEPEKLDLSALYEAYSNPPLEKQREIRKQRPQAWEDYLEGRADYPFTRREMDTFYQSAREGARENLAAGYQEKVRKHGAEIAPVDPEFYLDSRDDALLAKLAAGTSHRRLNTAEKNQGAMIVDRALRLSEDQEFLSGGQDACLRGTKIDGQRLDEYLRVRYDGKKISSRSMKCELLSAMLQGKKVEFARRPWLDERMEKTALVSYDGTDPRVNGGMERMQQAEQKETAPAVPTRTPVTERLGVSAEQMMQLYRERGKARSHFSAGSGFRGLVPDALIRAGKQLYDFVLPEDRSLGGTDGVYIDGRKAIDYFTDVYGEDYGKFLKENNDALKTEIMGEVTGARHHVDFLIKDPKVGGKDPKTGRIVEVAMDLTLLDGQEHWYEKSRSHRASLLRQEPGGQERQAAIAARSGITLHGAAQMLSEQEKKEAPVIRKSQEKIPEAFRKEAAERVSFEKLQNEFQKKPEVRKRSLTQPELQKKDREARL